MIISRKDAEAQRKKFDFQINISLRLSVFARILIFVLLCSCSSQDPYFPVSSTGTLKWTVSHVVDDKPFEFNTTVYTNAAGNEYVISGLKYFISDITLYNNKGTARLITKPKDIFYVDEDIPSTKEISFTNQIPTGTYDSVSFIFGITGEKNQSYRFTNPPENLMAWPDMLGGGYHYMKLDGKWKDVNAMLQPFNFHLGIGQLYKGQGYNTDSIYAFVQNWFRVSLPGSGFTIHTNETLRMSLVMHIENWFDNPHIYNLDEWGGAIMQNQDAQQTIKENGWNVFSLSPENKSP